MYPYGIMKTPDYHTFYNVHDMLDRLTKLEQQNAALVEALKTVEWVKGYDPKGIPAPLYYSYCPWCKGRDHSVTCVREQALDGGE